MCVICYGYEEKKIDELLKKGKVICFDDEKQVRIRKDIEYIPVTEENFEDKLKKVLWKEVFSPIEICMIKNHAAVEQKIRYFSEGILFSASEYADFGIGFFQNFIENAGFLKEVVPFESLEGVIEGHPVCIVGAGKSVEKDVEFLKNFPGYIFAGGSAIAKLADLGVKPDMAASIDKIALRSTIGQADLSDIPFCFQMSINPRNLKYVQSTDLVLAPSNHVYPLEDVLMGNQASSFEGGWTVTTFLCQVAKKMGASKIILSGVDLTGCYAQFRQIETEDISKEKTFTQRDWLFSADWLKKFGKHFPLYRTQKVGLNIGALDIDECIFEKQDKIDLKEKMKKSRVDFTEPLTRLKKSLFIIEIMIEDKIKELEEAFPKKKVPSGFLDSFKGELFYDKHLFFLWEMYRPVYKRELKLESQFDETVHQMLFFQNITEGFLNLYDRAL